VNGEVFVVDVEEVEGGESAGAAGSADE